MSALPAEKVLLLDLRSTFSAGFDTRGFFLRGDRIGHRSRRRLDGFFTLWRWWRLRRRWLYRGCDWFFLRLLLDHVENSGRDERPAVIGTLHKRWLNNLHVAGVWIRAVIVILVELVKVTLSRELWRARQYK